MHLLIYQLSFLLKLVFLNFKSNVNSNLNKANLSWPKEKFCIKYLLINSKKVGCFFFFENVVIRFIPSSPVAAYPSTMATTKTNRVEIFKTV